MSKASIEKDCISIDFLNLMDVIFKLCAASHSYLTLLLALLQPNLLQKRLLLLLSFLISTSND